MNFFTKSPSDIFMQGFLKKVKGYIKFPQTTPLEAFKNSCARVTSILESGAIDERRNLEKSLAHITSALEPEPHDSNEFANYFIEEGVMEQICSRITPESKSELMHPLLSFFIRFLGASLNDYLNCVRIHDAYSSFLLKLEFFDRKCPDQTRQFLRDLWERTEEDPVRFQLLAIQSAEGLSYPILDYLTACCVSPLKNGSLARTLILKFFKNRSLRNDCGGYLEGKLWQVLKELLVTISGYAETIDFDGTMMRVLQWCGEAFEAAGNFPLEDVYMTIGKTLPPHRQLFAYSMFLSAIPDGDIRLRTGIYAIQKTVTETIEHALGSEKEMVIRSALSLLTQLIINDSTRVAVLPAVSAQSQDVVAAVPSLWGMEPCTKDPVTLDAPRGNGANEKIYLLVLRHLERFQWLSLNMCRRITEFLVLLFAFAPDLINEELTRAFRVAVEPYATTELPDTDIDASVDSAVVRAKILRDFARETHATFVASAPK